MSAGLREGLKPHQGYSRLIVVAYRVPELLVLQLVATRLLWGEPVGTLPWCAKEMAAFISIQVGPRSFTIPLQIAHKPIASREVSGRPDQSRTCLPRRSP
jgi:hypothetical protein